MSNRSEQLKPADAGPADLGLGLPATCGACQHSAWQRTPTGRIKRGTAGSCTKEKELLALYVVAKHPPCLVIGGVTMNRIWPDYDASGCPLRA